MMSPFEFVQITFAIILGLGVTTILNGLGEQLRHRRTRPMDALQVAACLTLLLVHLVWLWGFWQAQAMEWNFALFLAFAVPPICLALAAQVTRIDCSATAAPARAQYLDNAPALYSLWTAAGLCGALLGFAYVATVDDYDRGEFALFSGIRVLGSVLLFSLVLCVMRPFTGSY